MAPVTWSDRERELLAVTLRLLQEHGYERLTLDDVAATGRASKATMYRRWPTKAELVLAAFIEGVSQDAVPPDTGNLREDLIAIGDTVCAHVREHGSTLRAVLGEASRNTDLNDVLQEQLFDQRRAMMKEVLTHAADRGEICPGAVNSELWDLLPGYLIYRAVIQNRPATRRTVRTLVDDMILPSLMRSAE
ncbi:MAG: TetR/AcrR family transcriptional regulator [Actinomycetota bacterium]|nr:TetR/AcrR family transcriptional regulator [Actinomycetota bacterium]MDA2950780.1 TetR/AcrR family transcriptional regulator [Actinomycetota bacterium]